MTNGFPEVEGSNLEGQKLTLPYDLAGKLNIVIIAFKRYQQRLVDDWIPSLEKLTQMYPEIEFYEVPTLAKGYLLMRFIIDGGMRSGIPSRQARERTITIYINKRQFKEKLDISSENTIYLFLVTTDGKILRQEEGAMTEAKIRKLQNQIKEYLNQNK
ncbi:MAG: hypothetical protein ACFFCQ_10265 [Promethearchaeota archaeon]